MNSEVKEKVENEKNCKTNSVITAWLIIIIINRTRKAKENQESITEQEKQK